MLLFLVAAISLMMDISRNQLYKPVLLGGGGDIGLSCTECGDLPWKLADTQGTRAFSTAVKHIVSEVRVAALLKT